MNFTAVEQLLCECGFIFKPVLEGGFFFFPSLKCLSLHEVNNIRNENIAKNLQKRQDKKYLSSIYTCQLRLSYLF